MTNPIIIYNKILAQHIFTSEIISKKFSAAIQCKNTTVTLKTQNEYIDFLNFYLLTGYKFQRKKFYLSSSQKKYQTLVVNQAILTTKLNYNVYLKLMSYLFRFIFMDFIKQIQESAVDLKKDAFVIRMFDIPVLTYNKSVLFKSIFAHNINILNMEFYMHFQTKSLAKQIVYLKFFRYIVPVYITWT